jgi:hypothetical protein
MLLKQKESGNKPDLRYASAAFVPHQSAVKPSMKFSLNLVLMSNKIQIRLTLLRFLAKMLETIE